MKPQQKSKWRLHFEKVAKDNPHLKNNRDRNKLASEIWLKKYPIRLKIY